MSERHVAIVLAGGSGKRMNCTVHKQFLLLKGKPLIFYALNAFEKSKVDEIVLVTAEGEEDYCKKEIVERYGFHKVTQIVAGGKERYHSVFSGLQSLHKCDYVYIHDGARPFIDQDIINVAYENVRIYKACVTAIPVTDTIKRADDSLDIVETIPRENLWSIQTPQCFSYQVIKEAYDKLLNNENNLLEKGIIITDDSMVVETFTTHKIKIIKGSYRNRKVTTQEDLLMMEHWI